MDKRAELRAAIDSLVKAVNGKAVLVLDESDYDLIAPAPVCLPMPEYEPLIIGSVLIQRRTNRI